jgi:hypothetical protein
MPARAPDVYHKGDGRYQQQQPRKAGQRVEKADPGPIMKQPKDPCWPNLLIHSLEAIHPIVLL